MKNIIKFILFIMSLLPLSALRGVGAIVGSLGDKLSKRASVRLRNNLLATHMCTNKQVDEMAKSTAKELGKTLIESLCIAWARSKYYSANLIVKVVNEKPVWDAISNNQAVLFLTPHIGNFEIIVKYAAVQFNKQVTVIYKPDKNQMINDFMIKGRSEDNLDSVPTNRKGVLKLVRALQNREIVGMLPDSVASQGEGVWTKFFNKKVFATTLAAKLALMPNVKTFIAYSYRVKLGFVLEFIPFNPGSSDISKEVREIYTIIEGLILRSPTEYYWSYDRFRVPSGQTLPQD